MKLLIKCINVCNEGCDWFKHTTFDSYAYTDAECTHPKGKGVDVWTNRNKIPINCPLPDSRSPLPDSPVEISRDKWQNLANDIKKWSDSTFGMFRLPKAMVNHLKKEVNELSEALEVYYEGNYSQEIYFLRVAKVKEEFADCTMLLLDAVSHFEGMTIPKLMDETIKKLEVNKGRKWGKEDESGVIEHLPEG